MDVDEGIRKSLEWKLRSLSYERIRCRCQEHMQQRRARRGFDLCLARRYRSHKFVLNEYLINAIRLHWSSTAFRSAVLTFSHFDPTRINAFFPAEASYVFPRPDSSPFPHGHSSRNGQFSR
jgi:hypothetical protein